MLVIGIPISEESTLDNIYLDSFLHPHPHPTPTPIHIRFKIHRTVKEELGVSLW